MALARTSADEGGRGEQRAFQVRLAADLHARLQARAKATPFSMNQLVEAGVRNVVDEGGEIPLAANAGATGVSDASEDLVLAALTGEIGALKGIARHYGNLGLSNLSGLLYAMAAEVVASSDPKLASKELTRTASRFMHHKRDLAVALLQAALRHNPQNEVAKNLLGQALYFAGDYAGAVQQLDSVRHRENRAKLFHGRAALYLARDVDNRSDAKRAREEIVAALEAWAFGSQDTRERASWLRQIAELDHLGTEFRQSVDELLEYANDNTSWPEVSRSDLTAAVGAGDDPVDM